MDTTGIAEPRTLALDGVEDEELAAASDATLLITASASLLAEALARRIHATGARAALPFVQTWACDFPIDRQIPGAMWSGLLDAAAGGSILVSDVEEMPRIAQHVFIELLAALAPAGQPLPLVRIICGTTVSLVDRIATGRFSERLFYRLNTIAITAM